MEGPEEGDLGDGRPEEGGLDRRRLMDDGRTGGGFRMMG